MAGAADRGVCVLFVHVRDQRCLGWARISTYDFHRVPLNFLHPPSIEVILDKTWVDVGTAIPLKDYFGLSDSDKTRAARHLFEQTNGHPRALKIALKACMLSKDIFGYDGSNYAIEWD